MSPRPREDVLQPTGTSLAMAFWIAWAVVVWNVVFDHVIVVAGRQYLNAAGIAAQGSGAYARL